MQPFTQLDASSHSLLGKAAVVTVTMPIDYSSVSRFPAASAVGSFGETSLIIDSVRAP